MTGGLELFGAELSRGPFTSHRIETAALQIAAALAQPRHPLARTDDALREHASFIRELADRIAPDWAAAITLDVGPEISDDITTTINAGVGAYSLLHCWLADDIGEGETLSTPPTFTWLSGVVLDQPGNCRFVVITPSTGVATVSVTQAGAASWRWAVSRLGRVYYSAKMSFA